MWFLLVISILVPVVLIGYCLSRLDKFLEKDGFKKASDEMRPVAIVLGCSVLAEEITGFLQENTIEVYPLSEPFLLEQRRNFRYLFAVSESDADNIVICKICRRVYGVKKMIGLCNDRSNEGMFISEKIRYVTGKEATSQMLCQLVLEGTEETS